MSNRQQRKMDKARRRARQAVVIDDQRSAAQIAATEKEIADFNANVERQRKSMLAFAQSMDANRSCVY